MRKRTLWILVLVLCALPSFAKSFTPKKNTRADIKAYVQHAAKVVAKSGPSCKTFEGKEWRAGDYYVFVIGPDDKTLCHPKASLIGKPTNEIVDEKGRHVGNEIAAAGKKKGGGWVEYMWPRPGTDKAIPKSTYATHMKGPDGKTYVVGSGGYDVK